MKEIAEEGRNKNILKKNIDDSLEYKEYNEEESMRNVENRERMYSPPKKHMETNNIYGSRDNRAYKNSDCSGSKAELKRSSMTPQKGENRGRQIYLTPKKTQNIDLPSSKSKNKVGNSGQNVAVKEMPSIKLQSSFSKKVYLQKQNDSMCQSQANNE